MTTLKPETGRMSERDGSDADQEHQRKRRGWRCEGRGDTEIRVMEENGGKSKREAGPAGKYDKKTTGLSS